LAVVPAFAQTRPAASNAGDMTGADWKKIAVQVDAPSTVGGYPAKLTAHGRDTTTAPMNVSYQWLRSDGQTSTGSVAIDLAGTKTVEYSGTVAGSGDGWIQLRAAAPIESAPSNKGNFRVICGAAKRAPAK
jgi:hypothetical protein